jgi:sporulation protein YlmC with PRC-barrel domain
VVTDSPVFLSRLLGRPVRSSDGVRVGRVVDMTVVYDIAHPNIHRLGVGRGRRIRYLLPWRLVHSYGEEEVRLSVDRMGLSAYAASPDRTMEDRELLLAHDVADTQVVDLGGRRLSRVSDVFIVAGHDGQFEVSGVDVGVGSLLRRMGFRRLGDRFRPVAVDWAGLHQSPSTGLNFISRPVGVTSPSSRPQILRCTDST